MATTAKPHHPPSKYDFLAKLVMLGDSGVGKTCSLLRFTESDFTRTHMSTVGVDFRVRTVEVEHKLLKLQVWDTAGQEQYRAIVRRYLRDANGILLVYDVTDEMSFANIKEWIEEAQGLAPQDVCKVLLANKCDLKNHKVDSAKGKRLASELGVSFFETSAATGQGVEDAFMTLVRQIYQKKFAHLTDGVFALPQPGVPLKDDRPLRSMSGNQIAELLRSENASINAATITLVRNFDGSDFQTHLKKGDLRTWLKTVVGVADPSQADKVMVVIEKRGDSGSCCALM